MPFSEEDGGLGGSAVDLMVIMEEFGKANLVEPYTATAVLGGSLVANLATGEQKETLLGGIIGGELQIAPALPSQMVVTIQPVWRLRPLLTEIRSYSTARKSLLKTAQMRTLCW